ncbi:hypothetical protein LguiA_009014 [Lonicera macranthoides]
MVKILPDVSFRETVPFPSTLEVAELPIYINYPSPAGVNEENAPLVQQMCLVALESTHQSVLLLIRLTSVTTAEKFPSSVTLA